MLSKRILIVFFILAFISSYKNIAYTQQNKTPADFDFRHFTTNYKGDTIDILIKSKHGEENKKKPLFLFCQGSLPQPLIKTDGEAVYGVFPFNPDILTEKYHLAIIGKPYIPLIADKKELGDNLMYLEKSGIIPKKYSNRNLLSYYVNRNVFVIKFLNKQPFIDHTQLIIAGHSEGSTIAAKLATQCKEVTHLIYASGNPMGRIMSIIANSRFTETDSTHLADKDFELWQKSVNDPNNLDNPYGDTFKATVEFSFPPINYLRQLKIPVLVSYGTKDWCAPFNDYFRAEVIQQHKKNFTFKDYIGTEHNFFPINKNGEINYEIFNWDKVAWDWLGWLSNN